MSLALSLYAHAVGVTGNCCTLEGETFLCELSYLSAVTLFVKQNEFPGSVPALCSRGFARAGLAPRESAEPEFFNFNVLLGTARHRTRSL